MKNVLIIEDNQDVRENMAEILELENYAVRTAENGEKGVEIAKLLKPDIIICDIMMPKLNGYDVLLRLREDNTTASIPFVFLTAKTERIDVRKGMNLGADDYLTKPFEESELIAVIAARLKKYSFLRAEFSRDIEGVNHFFSEASLHESVASLSENRVAVIVNKKEVIFKEGEAANTLYFIQKGAIKTMMSSASGKSLVTGLFGAGQFVGQLALLNESGVYKDTAIAIEPTEVFEIPKADFIAVLSGDTLISNDLIELQEQLVSMAFSSVRQRLAKVLMDLLNKENLYNNENREITISREDLASLVGTATVTTIRMLTNFKEEKLLFIGAQSEIIIQDKKSLEEIALFG
jgi:DNA-binding response OmpR family regulator